MILKGRSTVKKRMAVSPLRLSAEFLLWFILCPRSVYPGMMRRSPAPTAKIAIWFPWSSRIRRFFPFWEQEVQLRNLHRSWWNMRWEMWFSMLEKIFPIQMKKYSRRTPVNWLPMRVRHWALSVLTMKKPDRHFPLMEFQMRNLSVEKHLWQKKRWDVFPFPSFVFRKIPSVMM